jgi:hypothetical protein
VQKQIRMEMLPVGAKWWMARSARAALMALHLSGVVFRRRRKPARLMPWEGRSRIRTSGCRRHRRWRPSEPRRASDGGCGRRVRGHRAVGGGARRCHSRRHHRIEAYCAEGRLGVR